MYITPKWSPYGVYFKHGHHRMRYHVLVSIWPLLFVHKWIHRMSNINITSLHTSMINIARWRLLKVLIFGRFGYPIFERIFPLHNKLKWNHKLHGHKYYSDTFRMVYESPSSSLRMRRYEFFHPITQPKNWGRLN
jgi:hypothetical protein